MAVEYGGTVATEARQTEGNDSLASLDGKLNSLGQKTMAGSVPVVIASDQTIVINADTSGLATAAAQTTGNTSLAAINTKLPSGLTVSSTRLLTDASGVTQPVSAAALPLPSGASTESTLSTLNGKVPSGLTVSSTRLLVDPSGVTQPVSASALPLPSGAATSASQTTGNTSLSSIDGKITTLNGLLTSIYARLGAIMANVTASGNVSLATEHVVLDCDGLGTALIRITGTWTGAINFYASVKASPDPTADTDYFGAAGCDYIALDGQIVASSNANGVFAFNLAGLTQIRFRPASNLTGTATIQICGSPAAALPIGISATVFTAT